MWLPFQISLFEVSYFLPADGADYYFSMIDKYFSWWLMCHFRFRFKYFFISSSISSPMSPIGFLLTFQFSLMPIHHGAAIFSFLFISFSFLLLLMLDDFSFSSFLPIVLIDWFSHQYDRGASLPYFHFISYWWFFFSFFAGCEVADYFADISIEILSPFDIIGAFHFISMGL